MAVYTCPSDSHSKELRLPETGIGGKTTGGWTADNMKWARGSYRGMSGYCNGKWSGRACWWEFPPASPLPVNTRGLLHYCSGTRPADSYENSPFGPVSAAEIRDGLSNTVAAGEAAFESTAQSEARETYWAYTSVCYNLGAATSQSRSLIADYDRCVAIGGAGGSNPYKRGWGSMHAGGRIQFVRADNSVTSITPNIQMDVFRAMATIAGNDIVPPNH